MEVTVMMKLILVLTTSLLSLAVYASGPGGDPGAGGYFSEYLSASERSDDGMTYVSISRQEYSDGYAYGWLYGYSEGKYFDCYLDSQADLLMVDGSAEEAVIEIDQDDVTWCYSSELPGPITFDCLASGYMTSKGVRNEETTYHDGYVYKGHASYSNNSLDCVVTIGEEIELNAETGIVYDGTAEVQKLIYPYQNRDRND
jgi:hypothetical protein